MFQHQALVEAYLLPAQLVLALMGMGATLGVRDFALVGRNPGGLLAGALMQLLVVPALAVAFIHGFGLGPGWAVGFVLIAVVPSGALGNLMTFFGRGNVALSISLTSATTLGSVLTIPLLLRLLAARYLPPDFEFPTGKIVGDVCLFLLLPLAAGMVLYRLSPALARRISKVCIGAALLSLLLVTVSSLGSGRIKIPEYGWVPPALIVLFAVSLVVSTPLVCRLLRRPDTEAVAVSIGTMVRNMGVALIFVPRFFPGEPAQAHVLYTCLFFGGLTGPFALLAMFRHRSGKSVLPLLPRSAPASPPHDPARPATPDAG